jgi:hypothetical protein
MSSTDGWRIRFLDGREVAIRFEQYPGGTWVADDGTEEEDPDSLVGGQGDTVEAAAINMLCYAVRYDNAIGLLAPGERVVRDPTTTG